MFRASLSLLAACALAGDAGAQAGLLVCQSTDDVVMLLDPTDGSLVEAVFIDLNGHGGVDPITPIEALEVADEIWVTDQFADTIFRFSLDGSIFLGETGSGGDNMRGMGLADGDVWVTNSGIGGAGYGDALLRYDLQGVLLGVVPAGDPFDVVDYLGMLLVSNIAGDDIDRYDYAGNFLGAFHDSDGIGGIDFPEQLAVKASSGNLLACGFEPPSGIYEYDPSGAQVAFIDTGMSGLRGVHELQNGNLLFTNAQGVHLWDVQAQLASTVVAGVDARFINPWSAGLGPVGTSYCTPALPNSSGASASIAGFGSQTAGGEPLTLSAQGLPAFEFGYFLTSQTQGFINPPGSVGLLCLGGTIGRFNRPGEVQDSGPAGAFELEVDTLGLPLSPPVAAMAGETWNFQAWFRDHIPALTSNFSDGLEIRFR